MELEHFKRTLRVLPPEDSLKWRECYIQKFIDHSSPFYEKNVLKLRKFSDGEFYDGYLWDCVINIQTITFDDFSSKLINLKSCVMAMWDLHSQDKIRVPNYWKFGRGDVLRVDSAILCEGLEHLPEDIYIFDETLSWTLISTHEYRDNNSRICAVSYGNGQAVEI